MKIVAISDTHQTFPKLPKGDILIHCGDYSLLPKSSKHHFNVTSKELKKLNNWK